MKVLELILLLANYSSFLVFAVPDPACRNTEAIIDDDKTEVSCKVPQAQ